MKISITDLLFISLWLLGICAEKRRLIPMRRNAWIGVVIPEHCKDANPKNQFSVVGRVHLAIARSPMCVKIYCY